MPRCPEFQCVRPVFVCAHASLLSCANPRRVQREAKTTLFRMCYEDGLNISTKEAVAQAADEIGLTNGKARLLSDEGAESVLQKCRHASVDGKRISGVPFYSVNRGAVKFSGATSSTEWSSILSRLCAQQG